MTYTATVTKRSNSNLYQVFKDGVLIDKRVSKGRVYSRVVLARPSHEKALEDANAGVWKSNDAYRYNNEAKIATMQAGDLDPYYSYHSYTLTQERIEQAQALLVEYPSLESFLAARLEWRLQQVADAKANGLYDTYRAVSYSSRLELALRDKNNRADAIVVAIDPA